MSSKLPVVPIPFIGEQRQPEGLDAMSKRMAVLTSAVQSLLGGGSQDTRVITVADLENLGIDRSLIRVDTPSLNVTGITGGKTKPSPPSSLRYTTAGAQIRLEWDAPKSSYSHIEIWRSATQYVTDVELVGVATRPQTVWVGGPFSPRLDNRFWIRAVGYDGTFSDWHPATDSGGLLLPSGFIDINSALDQIFDDDRYQDHFKIKAESFEVYQPAAGFPDGKKVFAIANINGVPAMGFKGDMFLDGILEARMIGTNQIIANQANIADAVITNAHIASLSGEKIMAGTIGANQLMANSITADKIVADSIDARLIRADTIEANHIKGNAVTPAKVESGIVLEIATGGGSANVSSYGQIIVMASGIAATGQTAAVRVNGNNIATYSEGTPFSCFWHGNGQGVEVYGANNPSIAIIRVK